MVNDTFWTQYKHKNNFNLFVVGKSLFIFFIDFQTILDINVRKIPLFIKLNDFPLPPNCNVA